MVFRENSANLRESNGRHTRTLVCFSYIYFFFLQANYGTLSEAAPICGAGADAIAHQDEQQTSCALLVVLV